jgi:flagellar motility protein MotE (MotC chaperone)
MEQKLEGLLAGQEEMMARLEAKIEAKMDAWLEEMKAW